MESDFGSSSVTRYVCVCTVFVNCNIMTCTISVKWAKVCIVDCILECTNVYNVQWYVLAWRDMFKYSKQWSVNVLQCWWRYIHDHTCLDLIWWCTLSLTHAMIWFLPWCDDILLCTMMRTCYIHITCWWWWWLLDDDDSTYPMTLMYNLWWSSAMEEQRYFSDCGWQWAVCGSDIYKDDLMVIRVQRLSAVDLEFGMW